MYLVKWLRRLIEEGHLPEGKVDPRSIQSVQPEDLEGFTQHHFFAGIGGWPLALRMAGWPEDLPVWTGSAPCQPFSQAGKKKGFADDRHLWPEWLRLIKARSPRTIFGEQVASSDGLQWLDIVCSDLEELDYDVGALDLCAASVGAPHVRQRLYLVGHAAGDGLHALDEAGVSFEEGWVQEPEGSGHAPDRTFGHWADPDWIPSTDGLLRPVESGTFPLADGFPARVEQMRAYGNALVPQLAAKFIRAYMDVHEISPSI